MRPFLILAALLLIASPAAAGDDPSIQGETRNGVQAAMTRFIAAQEVDGALLHYDPAAGKLLRLKLDELHEGIVRKGDFYVSCADFVSHDGTAYDIDFLVVPAGDSFRVNQAIVHSVAGEKRKYHLEGSWPSLFGF
jgi:hypothetical protein